jgi:hypothetical protein
MYGLKTLQWFGIQSVNDRANIAPERTGAWIRLEYQLSHKKPGYPRYWRQASQLMAVVRPDLSDDVKHLSARQAERALTNLLDQHAQALGLPNITPAEQDLANPSPAQGVPLYESPTLSHALTTFAVLTKTMEGICSPQRATCTSVLYAPQTIKHRHHRESVWEIALWLDRGYATLLTAAIRSPANRMPLEALL